MSTQFVNTHGCDQTAFLMSPVNPWDSPGFYSTGYLLGGSGTIVKMSLFRELVSLILFHVSLSPPPPPLHPLSLYGKCPPTTSNKMLKISFEASLDSKDVLSLFSHSFPAARLSYPFFSFLADPGRKRSRANGAISKAPRHDSFNVSIVYSRSHTQYSNRFFRRISRPRILILCL